MTTEEDFIVTLTWIEANKTDRGAWRQRQLEQIGVSWPPPKGWKMNAVGKVITEEQRRVFEAFAASL